MLTSAGQPEILRAAQRDEYFQKQLSENVSEILQSLFGVHFWIKYKDAAKVLSNILYQVTTTMFNLQTLGEEYTGIVQVDSTKKSLPKKYLQFLMILLNNCGEKFLTESLKSFEKKVENLPKEHPLQPSARQELIKLSNSFKKCLPFLQKIHKSIFYFNGCYYYISKRICGIQYVLVRYWLKERSSLPVFKLLGFFSAVQLAMITITSVLNYKNMDLEKRIVTNSLTERVDSFNKCSLCLNASQHTSITPCGHLFCWSCIIAWLQEQPKCPLCRQTFQPSRVVFLQNYSNS